MFFKPSTVEKPPLRPVLQLMIAMMLVLMLSTSLVIKPSLASSSKRGSKRKEPNPSAIEDQAPITTPSPRHFMFTVWRQLHANLETLGDNVYPFQVISRMVDFLDWADCIWIEGWSDLTEEQKPLALERLKRTAIPLIECWALAAKTSQVVGELPDGLLANQEKEDDVMALKRAYDIHYRLSHSGEGPNTKYKALREPAEVRRRFRAAVGAKLLPSTSEDPQILEIEQRCSSGHAGQVGYLSNSLEEMMMLQGLDLEYQNPPAVVLKPGDWNFHLTPEKIHQLNKLINNKALLPSMSSEADKDNKDGTAAVKVYRLVWRVFRPELLRAQEQDEQTQSRNPNSNSNELEETISDLYDFLSALGFDERLPAVWKPETRERAIKIWVANVREWNRKTRGIPWHLYQPLPFYWVVGVPHTSLKVTYREMSPILPEVSMAQVGETVRALFREYRAAASSSDTRAWVLDGCLSAGEQKAAGVKGRPKRHTEALVELLIVNQCKQRSMPGVEQLADWDEQTLLPFVPRPFVAPPTAPPSQPSTLRNVSTTSAPYYNYSYSNDPNPNYLEDSSSSSSFMDDYGASTIPGLVDSQQMSGPNAMMMRQSFDQVTFNTSAYHIPPVSYSSSIQPSSSFNSPTSSMMSMSMPMMGTSLRSTTGGTTNPRRPRVPSAAAPHIPPGGWGAARTEEEETAKETSKTGNILTDVILEVFGPAMLDDYCPLNASQLNEAATTPATTAFEATTSPSISLPLSAGAVNTSSIEIDQSQPANLYNPAQQWNRNPSYSPNAFMLDPYSSTSTSTTTTTTTNDQPLTEAEMIAWLQRDEPSLTSSSANSETTPYGYQYQYPQQQQVFPLAQSIQVPQVSQEQQQFQQFQQGQITLEDYYSNTTTYNNNEYDATLMFDDPSLDRSVQHFLTGGAPPPQPQPLLSPQSRSLQTPPPPPFGQTETVATTSDSVRGLLDLFSDDDINDPNQNQQQQHQQRGQQRRQPSPPQPPSPYN